MKKILSLFLTVILLSSHMIYPKAEEPSPQSITNLVVFTRMKGDSKDIYNANNNVSKLTQMYNGDFADYIEKISDGKAIVTNPMPQLTNGTIGTYTFSQSTYSDDSAMITEVIQAFNRGDISLDTNIKYDNWHSGIIDNLTIIVQGEAVNGYKHNYQATYPGTDTLNGYRVAKYNMLHSSSLIVESGYGLTSEATVIAHEFLHALDFPDLYVNGSSSRSPVGPWDIMSSVGYFPQYTLGYLRYRAGWIDAKEISDGGTYTLNDVTLKGDRLIMIKTPMAESESEYICLEYRRLGKTFNEPDYLGSTAQGGLLMYRVNLNTSLSNISGDEYIYVYRDEDEGSNPIYSAPISPKFGETEYGSLNETATSRVLTYSDGANSGVKISECVLSADESSITFKVDIAKFENSTWDKLTGANITDASYNPIKTAKCNNQVYLAYQSTDKKIVLTDSEKRLTQIPFNSGFTLFDIARYRDELYLAYTENNVFKVGKYHDGSYYSVTEFSGVTPNSLELFNDGDNLYIGVTDISFSSTTFSERVTFYNALSGEVIDNSLTRGSFGNPGFFAKGGYIYAAYNDFFGDNQGYLDAFNLTSHTWETKYNVDCSGSNVHQIIGDGDNIYAMFSNGEALRILNIINGTVTTLDKANTYPSIVQEKGRLFLLYSDEDNRATACEIKSGEINTFAGFTTGSLLEMTSLVLDDKILAVTQSMQSNNINIYYRGLPVDDSIPSPRVTITGFDLYSGNYSWKSSEKTLTILPDDLMKVSQVTIDGNTLAESAIPSDRILRNLTGNEVIHIYFTPVFNDVNLSYWYKDYIAYVYNNKYMTGKNSEIFAPDSTLTRAELVQILYNKAGRPNYTTPCGFSDVSISDWCYPAICWAKENNIVTGYSWLKFGPYDPVQRQDLAVILYREKGSPDTQNIPDEILKGFPDENRVYPYALPALKWAVSNKIIGGVTIDRAKYISPRDSATRAQTAAMIQNYCVFS